MSRTTWTIFLSPLHKSSYDVILQPWKVSFHRCEKQPFGFLLQLWTREHVPSHHRIFCVEVLSGLLQKTFVLRPKLGESSSDVAMTSATTLSFRWSVFLLPSPILLPLFNGLLRDIRGKDKFSSREKRWFRASSCSTVLFNPETSSLSSLVSAVSSSSLLCNMWTIASDATTSWEGLLSHVSLQRLVPRSTVMLRSCKNVGLLRHFFRLNWLSTDVHSECNLCFNASFSVIGFASFETHLYIAFTYRLFENSFSWFTFLTIRLFSVTWRRLDSDVKQTTSSLSISHYKLTPLATQKFKSIPAGTCSWKISKPSDAEQRPSP